MRHARFRGWLSALVVALWSLLSSAPLAAIAMSKGQQILPISHQECLSRAAAALRTTGYTSWGDAGNGSWGERQNQGAVIFCEVTVGEREVVDIVVATAGSDDPGVPGAERVRLQQLMAQPSSPSAPTGGVAAGCSAAAYSVTVEPALAQPGQQIAIRYTSQGRMHERDWIGIYPAGQGPTNKIDWVYTRVREADCRWIREAPPPGEYEVAYLLDDSYDQIRARARLTVGGAAATRPIDPAQRSCWDWSGEFLDGRQISGNWVSFEADGTNTASWGWKGRWTLDPATRTYRIAWQDRAPGQEDVLTLSPDGRELHGRNFETKWIRGVLRLCP